MFIKKFQDGGFRLAPTHIQKSCRLESIVIVRVEGDNFQMLRVVFNVTKDKIKLCQGRHKKIKLISDLPQS